MAKVYLEKLSVLVSSLKLSDEITGSIEAKHFFSGAALYVNGTICVSWSPVGLPFKLPQRDVEQLINSGKAKPLKYFPKGHIKKGYALFESPEEKKPTYWKKYFKVASEQV